MFLVSQSGQKPSRLESTRGPTKALFLVNSRQALASGYLTLTGKLPLTNQGCSKKFLRSAHCDDLNSAEKIIRRLEHSFHLKKVQMKKLIPV
jgi:hypothetical protein